jgi:hypothetical protein
MVPPMTFDAFVESAWNDHADDPGGVATRLESSLALVDAPARVAPYARLVTHVFGEHLGQWQRGMRVLALLATRSRDDADATRMLARSRATLAYAGGDASALAPLAVDDRIAALATASSAFAGRGDLGHALDAYADAVALAADGVPDGSPALRALAAGGNNLAATLEAKQDRDGRETRGMLDAARAALTWWRRAGTWLEEERAEYRLARSLLCAGQAAESAEHARRCLAICDEHAAPAFERFFGTVALALAQRDMGDVAAFAASRDRALAIHQALPADEREACGADLAEVQPR